MREKKKKKKKQRQKRLKNVIQKATKEIKKGKTKETARESARERYIYRERCRKENCALLQTEEKISFGSQRLVPSQPPFFFTQSTLNIDNNNIKTLFFYVG